eukprot:COSAG06_NODE_2271_length_7201_cov_3.437623_3_plen_44_part_00
MVVYECASVLLVFGPMLIGLLLVYSGCDRGRTGGSSEAEAAEP